MSGFDKISAFLDSVDADFSWLLALLKPCPRSVVPTCKLSIPAVKVAPPSANFPVPSAIFIAPLPSWDAAESNCVDLSVNWSEPNCNLVRTAINSGLLLFNWAEPDDSFSIPVTNSGVFPARVSKPVVNFEEFSVNLVEPETNWSKLVVKVVFFSLSWFTPKEIVSNPLVYALTPFSIDWLPGTNWLSTAFCNCVNPLDIDVKELDAIGKSWFALVCKVERLETGWFILPKFSFKSPTVVKIAFADSIVELELFETASVNSFFWVSVRDW